MANEWACEGKKRYLTPADAQGAADWVRNVRNERCSPYLCPKCGGWHLRNNIDAAHYWSHRQKKRSAASDRRKRRAR